MSSIPKTPYLTPHEYLQRERKSETKHEYYNGEVFAMSGGSPSHNQICVNVSGELRQRLRERDCIVYSSDQRVKVSRTGLYTYPDVTVVCGEAKFDEDGNDTLLNPKVLIEVLSPSTADYDRGGKFKHYRSLPSLEEYVTISQDRPLVEHFVRDGERWVLTEIDSSGDSLILKSLECELPLTEIYLKVRFDSASPAPNSQ